MLAFLPSQKSQKGLVSKRRQAIGGQALGEPIGLGKRVGAKGVLADPFDFRLSEFCSRPQRLENRKIAFCGAFAKDMEMAVCGHERPNEVKNGEGVGAVAPSESFRSRAFVRMLEIDGLSVGQKSHGFRVGIVIADVMRHFSQRDGKSRLGVVSFVAVQGERIDLGEKPANHVRARVKRGVYQQARLFGRGGPGVANSRREHLEARETATRDAEAAKPKKHWRARRQDVLRKRVEPNAQRLFMTGPRGIHGEAHQEINRDGGVALACGGKNFGDGGGLPGLGALAKFLNQGVSEGQGARMGRVVKENGDGHGERPKGERPARNPELG